LPAFVKTSNSSALYYTLSAGGAL